MDKLESVCLGHGLVFVSQLSSWLRLSIIQFSLSQFNSISTFIEYLQCAIDCAGCWGNPRNKIRMLPLGESFSTWGTQVCIALSVPERLELRQRCEQMPGAHRRQNNESSGGLEKTLWMWEYLIWTLKMEQALKKWWRGEVEIAWTKWGMVSSSVWSGAEE